MDKKIIVRNLVLLIVTLVLIILLVNFWPKLFVHKNNNFSNDVVIESNSTNTILIQSDLPMSDNSGKKISKNTDNEKVESYYEFNVVSKSTKKRNFEIYVSDDEFDNTLHPNYLKLYLTDEDNKPVKGYDMSTVPTFFEMTVSSFNASGKRIYYGEILPGETKKFILRSWVGDAYAVSTTTKSFGMKIFVEAD